MVGEEEEQYIPPPPLFKPDGAVFPATVLFVMGGEEDEEQYIPPPYLSGPDGVPFPLRIVKPSMVFVPMAWTEFDNAAHTSSIQYGYVGHPIPLPPLTFVPGESAVKIRIWMYDYPLIIRAGLYPHFTTDSRCGIYTGLDCPLRSIPTRTII